MPHFIHRRTFLRYTAGALVARSVGGCDAERMPRGRAASFAYGVASGDPLADRVILWTHARYSDSDEDVLLTWQVSEDPSFVDVVREGTALATAATGHTVKVDAEGLEPGRTYHYRFVDSSEAASDVGTTRTLPGEAATSVRFAVLGCALYSHGHFNVFDDVLASAPEYAVFLGDYIYEYGNDPSILGNEDAAALGRLMAPDRELTTLDDYRARYAHHRSDDRLQALHRAVPFIAVWDDHEVANNATLTGADGHDAAVDGDYATRLANAVRAFHEWTPIRTPNVADRMRIHRRFDFGELCTLHMLDARLGRDPEYENHAAWREGIESGLDAARSMLGREQADWLVTGLQESNAPWQILGSQLSMAPGLVPASVLREIGDATATVQAARAFVDAKEAARAGDTLTPAQLALLDPARNPRLPMQLGAWVGYPTERERVLTAARDAGHQVVCLAGDAHNAWLNDLTTEDGTPVGIEFGPASVSSPGYEHVGFGALGELIDGRAVSSQPGTGRGVIDANRYCETLHRGYVQLVVSRTSVTADFVFVSTIASRDYASEVGVRASLDRAGAATYSFVTP